MTLTIKTDAPTEDGRTIPSGSTVDYLGHVPGGMIAVLFEGVETVIHPRTVKGLR